MVRKNVIYHQVNFPFFNIQLARGRILQHEPFYFLSRVKKTVDGAWAYSFASEAFDFCNTCFQGLNKGLTYCPVDLTISKKLKMSCLGDGIW